jgi:hypothetical protein
MNRRTARANTMKRLLILAALIVAAAVSPALADDATAAPATAAAPAPALPATTAATPIEANVIQDGAKLSNFADLFFSGTVGESAPELTLDFVPGTVLGAMSLVFEKTRLDDLQKAFGGTLHAQGDAGNGVTWLCFTQHAATKADTPKTVWFTSTNEMADTGYTLSMVVVQNVDAAKVSGCATAPAALSFPSFGVPALGVSLNDLKQKFGSARRDRQGNVYFNSTRPTNDGSGMSIYQSAGYFVNKKGVVTGFALSQVTTD